MAKGVAVDDAVSPECQWRCYGQLNNWGATGDARELPVEVCIEEHVRAGALGHGVR